jgi:hypothetical protein
MGLRFDKAAAIQAIQSENGLIDSKLNSIESQLNVFWSSLDTTALQGEAYASIESRIKDLRIPLLKAHYISFESLHAANSQNINLIEALPESSPGVYDTEMFYRQIEKHQKI